MVISYSHLSKEMYVRMTIDVEVRGQLSPATLYNPGITRGLWGPHARSTYRAISQAHPTFHVIRMTEP